MRDEDLELVRIRLAGLQRPWQAYDVAWALKELGFVLSDSLVMSTIEALRQSSVGLGRLEVLLQRPGLSDILVNGPDQVFVDCGRGLEKVDITFASDDEVRRLAVRLAAGAGRRLDDACPYVDARLGGGIRFHAILSTLAEPGTCLSLRIPSGENFSLKDWLASKSLNWQLEKILRAIVEQKTAFLISGGTGSGKTTLMASLLSLVNPDERIVIVEDSRELNPAHSHCVRLETKVANTEGAGAVGMTELVKQALRMRPDRLVVGEVRGGELCDLLAALNTGHEGGCGTVHANSIHDIPARLEALAALGSMNRQTLAVQVGAALRLVIQVIRRDDGRRHIKQVGLLECDRREGIRVIEALSYDGDSPVRTGPGWEQMCEMLSLNTEELM